MKRRLSAVLVDLPLVALPKGQPRLVLDRRGGLAIRLEDEPCFRNHVEWLPRPELNPAPAKRRRARLDKRRSTSGRLSTRRSFEANSPLNLARARSKGRSALVTGERERADQAKVPPGLLIVP